MPIIDDLRSALYDRGPGSSARTRTAIATARQEIGRLKDQSVGAAQIIEFLGNHVSEQADKIERLRAALMPFVEIDPIDYGEVEYICGEGSIARARSALGIVDEQSVDRKNT